MKRPGIVLGMAGITVLALFVALGLILFSVNPTQRSTQGELKVAVMSQHAIICAQVQNTANSYRFRSLTPSGNVEPIRHFLTRMQAQQQTLRLARGSECRSAPGFPPVGLQVRRALRQIHEILQHFEPKLREPVSRGISHRSAEPSHKQGGFLSGISRPPHAGIDESGVPHQLKPELAPSAPTGPQTGHSRTAPPVEQPQVESPAPEEPPTSASPPGTNVVAEPKRPELPTTPIKVEVKPPEVTIEGIP
jgi:hypothetical protein